MYLSTTFKESGHASGASPASRIFPTRRETSGFIANLMPPALRRSSTNCAGKIFGLILQIGLAQCRNSPDLMRLCATYKPSLVRNCKTIDCLISAISPEQTENLQHHRQDYLIVPLAAVQAPVSPCHKHTSTIAIGRRHRLSAARPVLAQETDSRCSLSLRRHNKWMDHRH